MENAFSRKIGYLRRKGLAAPLLIALIVCSAVGGALAVIMVYKEVSVSLVIEGLWNIDVLDTDQTTILAALDMGTMHRDEYKRFPESGSFWLKNTGDFDVYYSADLIDDPSPSAVIKVYIKRWAADPWELLSLGTEIYTFAAGPGVAFQWYCEAQISDSPAFDSYSPVIQWQANDAP